MPKGHVPARRVGARTEALNGDVLLAMLGENAVFGSCTPELLRAVIERASYNLAQRGTSVAQAGVPFPFLGFVCKGALSVTLNSEGPIRGVHRWQMYQADAGDIFGEAVFLAGEPLPGDIVVVSKSATYVLFPASTIEVAIMADPDLLRRLAKHVASKTVEVARRVIGSQAQPVAARIASVLLRFASDAEGLQPGRKDLAEITQRDIAAAASCVKESAARAITQLESLGALRRVRGHIVYLNRERLLECAGKVTQII